MTLKSIARKWLSRPASRLAAKCPNRTVISTMRTVTGIQLSSVQIYNIAQAVRSYERCNFLVFGLGKDSPFWAFCNKGGTTVFLEDDTKWFDFVMERNKFLRAHLVKYTTIQSDWKLLSESAINLDMNLSGEVLDRKWNVILVDAPNGFSDDGPGRMQSIHMARKLVAPGGVVYVHDCERESEAFWSDKIFSDIDRIEIKAPRPIGLLRRFDVP